MKKGLFIQLGLIFLIIFSHTTIHAQDYTQMHLPEGAKMRFGKGEIYDIKFSPDGNMLAVGSAIGIWLYDVKTNKPLSFFKVQTHSIHTIGFINEGKNIIGLTKIGFIYIWDIDTNENPRNQNKGKLYKRIPTSTPFWASAISNEGSILAVGSGDGSITLWNIKSGEQIASIKAHKESVNGLAFSTDGTSLASSGEDSEIHLWDVLTYKLMYTHLKTFNAQALAFTSDDKYLLAGSFGGSVQSWNLDTRQKMISFKGHRDSIRAVAYSPDNKIVASGSWDSTVRLWNAVSGDQIGMISGHTLSVERMGFAPNGYTVAGTAKGVINLWDQGTRRENPGVIDKHPGLFRVLAFTNDSKELLYADVGFNLYVYNVNTTKEKATKKFKKHKGGYYAIAFSPDRSIVANGYRNNRIKLWNIDSGEELLSIRTKFKKPIITLAYSSDGNRIAAAGEDGIIKIWDTNKGVELCVLQGHSGRIYSVAFSPDGKLLASGSSDSTMRLWDIQQKRQINQQFAWLGRNTKVLFSLDEKVVVVSNTLNTILLWDLSNLTHTPGIILRGHNGWIRSLEFSADGKTLASGSDDGTILIWDWDKLTQMLNANNRKFRDN